MPTAELELPLAGDAATTGPVRFHLSLNVGDLTRAVTFFRSFFGLEPAKLRSDYAKFELDEPPLVLSLEPFQAQPGGNLNHLGFRLPSMTALVDYQRRLEMAGISTQREEGVECCYARQTKFWVHDPDGNLWEIYTFDGDIEHRGDGQVPDAVLNANTAADAGNDNLPPRAIWAHRLGEHFALPLPIQDATVDEVRLQGTFNAAQSAQQTAGILAEVVRILKPGGQVLLHVLTANRPLGDISLSLPGPAAAVREVPVAAELMQALGAAGLVNSHFTKHGESPCFVISGVEMRETKISSSKLVLPAPLA